MSLLIEYNGIRINVNDAKKESEIKKVLFNVTTPALAEEEKPKKRTSLERKREKHPSAHLPFSIHDLEKIWKWNEEGISISEIARTIGRTSASVSSQLYLLRKKNTPDNPV